MAKKRYYQNKKDRMDERRGMDNYEYKKREENRAGGMINEDPNAIANLPQQEMIKAYPKNEYHYAMDLNDDIRGVDAQMHEDIARKSKGKKMPYPEKY